LAGLLSEILSLVSALKIPFPGNRDFGSKRPRFECVIIGSIQASMPRRVGILQRLPRKRYVSRVPMMAGCWKGEAPPLEAGKAAGSIVTLALSVVVLLLRHRAGFSKDWTFMPTGKVKFYRDDTGYGLIEPDDGGKDVFVHITSVADPSVEMFREDRRVRYVERVSQRSGNPEAFDVVVL
jgi:cold shock protein